MLELLRGHLRSPVPEPGDDGAPLLLLDVEGRMRHVLVESENAFVVGYAQEGAECLARFGGARNQFFVAYLVVEFGSQRSTVFPAQAHVPLPPHRRRRYRVLRPGRKTAGQLVRPAPAYGRNTHVAAVADEVNELGLGPQGVQGGDAAHVTGNLVPHEALAVPLSVEIEDTGDEGRVGDRLLSRHQPFEFVLTDPHAGELLV